MRKYNAILSFLILMGFISSCHRSYECDCTTLHSNNSGSGSSSTVITNKYSTPYRMSRVKAESWCNGNERNEELGGGQHVNTSCTLSGR